MSRSPLSGPEALAAPPTAARIPNQMPSRDGSRASRAQPRPAAAGKFLVRGEEKFYVRGVTYGTFRPNADGDQFPAAGVVRADFAAMSAHGINSLRTYTLPPRWLLDEAGAHGLMVMAGVPWEQHVAFLDDRARMRAIERRVRAEVAASAGHPAVLCHVIGNEVPSGIVRWHGRRPVERFLERLYLAAKAEDPDGLVTYVNYPPTEYLDLSFLDLACFNVYLENRESLDAYLGRLHSLAGERPLLLAELGLDSRRNGESQQASALDWQLRSTFRSGCAGAFVFGWTDEWYVEQEVESSTGEAGVAIEDWDFGLTRRDRSPKPALESVSHAYAEVPVDLGSSPPRMSVVVCTHNGSRTLRTCLDQLRHLDYPDFEVIVVDDGSTDTSREIADDFGQTLDEGFDFRIISTDWRGLAHARNTGLTTASGEIVAYIDDDAWPDPHWLSYLAHTFATSTHVAAGGPNLGPPLSGFVAQCVAEAPGAPTHVLVHDLEAEHLPGCNMAFRRAELEAIGGFDDRYRAAGDDVDVCWRLMARGGTLGFHPAAMVWHRRRDTIRGYWKQQRGYGAAEALLEEKWPEKFNGVGHLDWRGHIYGGGVRRRWGRRRVDYGVWGTRLFQSLYEPRDGLLTALPLMPDWYLLLGVLAVLGAAGVLWSPLLLAVPALLLGCAASLAAAAFGAVRSPAPAGRSRPRLRQIALTTLLILLQPAARLDGRLRRGLTPLRIARGARWGVPRRRDLQLWSEHWTEPATRLERMESALRHVGVPFRRGGDHDRWDLMVRGGILASVRALLVVEEHGSGRQLLRLRCRPRCSRAGILLLVLLAAVGILAVAQGSWPVLGGALLLAAGAAARWVREASAAFGAMVEAFERCDREQPRPKVVLGGSVREDPCPTG